MFHVPNKHFVHVFHPFHEFQQIEGLTKIRPATEVWHSDTLKCAWYIRRGVSICLKLVRTLLNYHVLGISNTDIFFQMIIFSMHLYTSD